MAQSSSSPDTGSRTIVAHPITPEAFAPYGDVVQVAGPSNEINQGKGRRYPDLVRMDLANDGRASVCLMTCVPEATPVPLRLMERHPLGNQTFMPLGGQRYIVVVAPAGDPPAPEDIKAFLCNGDQGVNYHRGTWHHPMIALDAPCAFFEVQWRGERPNCDEEGLQLPMFVALPQGMPASQP